MPAQPFHIHHHPTDLTRRLLASTPGSTVTFTLDELLQSTVYHPESWTCRRICTGILTVFQMAAQHLDPSVAAQVALRATQYREQFCGMECSGCRGKSFPPGSHWRALQRYEGGKLCLRADPEKYPEFPIGCSSCIADGKQCDVITKNISIRDPVEWDEESDFDEPYGCDHESDCESCTSSHPAHDSEPKKEKERPVLEIPDLLQLAPTHTLQDLDEYFKKNPWGIPDSRDWGGGLTLTCWNDLFLVHTGGMQLGYYEDQDERYSRGWVNAETRERWIRELFGYFPGVIEEVSIKGEGKGENSDEKQVDAQLQEEEEEEDSEGESHTAVKATPTWSIIIPRSISSAPFPLDQSSQPRLNLPYDCPPPSPSPSPEPKPRFTHPPGSLGGPSGKGVQGKKMAAQKKQTQGKAGGSGGYAGGSGSGVKGGNAQAQGKGKGKKGQGKSGGGGRGKKGKGRQSNSG